MYNLTDTIAAISTPIGEGALSIVRIAGDGSKEIFKQIFIHHKIKNFDPRPFVAHYGEIRNETETIDSVITVYFPKPKSYTGEDQIEISCHGGYAVSKKVLDLIISKGARNADPGEFTYRAFLNGKLDLIQSEAVADIIHARTNFSLRPAIQQYEGLLSKKISSLRESLLHACSLIELELDFSTEDIEFIKKDDLLRIFVSTESQISELIDSFTFGRIQREGASIVIIGEPNVGKSSLLNCLLQEERSIVTEIPGTTRDTIEESFDLYGLLLKLTDTAGIRQVRDTIESKGIERTKKGIASADVILLVIDISQELSSNIISLIRSMDPSKILFLVGNKIDLKQSVDLSIFSKNFTYISALNNQGIEELKRKLFNSITEGYQKNSGDITITNIRHKEALIKANTYLKESITSLNNSISYDFVASDLRNSIEQLETIIGKVTSDDILNNIFSTFCIGK